MIKAFIVNKLTQLSAWLGVIIMLGAFVFPRSWIILLGAVLVFTDDVKLQKFFSKWSPTIKEALEKCHSKNNAEQEVK